MSAKGKPKQPPLPCSFAKDDKSLPKEINRDGGQLAWQGHVLDIPPDALSGPVTFQMFERAAPILKLVITADGKEYLKFNKPAKLTMNYAAGCFGQGRPPLPPQLQIVRLDSNDNTQDELGGNDVRPHKRVTTDIDHLSGYSVAGG